MTDSQDPYQNPPGWTDPYADLNDLSGDEPLPPMEPPTTPPAQPPGSPLLTGLIIGLLLIALSVAVFQLLAPEDDGTAGGTTTTTVDGTETTTTLDGDETTSTVPETSTTIPSDDPWAPVEPAIAVDRLKMMTNGLRVNDNAIPDIVFEQEADTAIGRLVASFGEPTSDTGWQLSTGQYGVCAGEPERIVTFGTYAAVVTKPGGTEIYNGYRQDINNGDFTHPAGSLETLSGLKLSDTVADLKEIYGASQDITFETDPRLGEVYKVTSTAGTLLLWGPVEGNEDDDLILGIYGPDECNR